LRETEAGNYVLNCVYELQAVVPREQWQFLPPVPVYFAEFEYRGNPTRFVSTTTRATGGAGDKEISNEEAFQDLLEACGEASIVWAPEEHSERITVTTAR